MSLRADEIGVAIYKNIVRRTPKTIQLLSFSAVQLQKLLASFAFCRLPFAVAVKPITP